MSGVEPGCTTSIAGRHRGNETWIRACRVDEQSATVVPDLDRGTGPSAGNSSLNYDGTVNPPIGQYIYVWKTDKAWANTCRRLDVQLRDGTTHSAKFKFTR
jgi:hypothetical protein